MKTLKFAPHLVKMILDGDKTCTWRVFDEKYLQIGDEIVFINKKTGKEFGTAKVLLEYGKTFGMLTEEDYVGHEGFASEEEMYETYRSYYPNQNINTETELKILRFYFTSNID